LPFDARLGAPNAGIFDLFHFCDNLIGKMRKVYAIAAALPVAFLIGCGSSSPETVAETIPATLPGNVCVVGGEELGSMGEIAEFNYNGNIIKFCCAHCIPDFKRHTEQYVAALKSGRPIETN
jgi:hypothetical protein